VDIIRIFHCTILFLNIACSVAADTTTTNGFRQRYLRTMKTHDVVGEGTKTQFGVRLMVCGDGRGKHPPPLHVEFSHIFV